MIYSAPCMFWMRAYPLRGRGLGIKIPQKDEKLKKIGIWKIFLFCLDRRIIFVKYLKKLYWTFHFIETNSEQRVSIKSYQQQSNYKM